MLPASVRMRSAEEFRNTVRFGVRCGRPSLVLHARRTAGVAPSPAAAAFPGVRVGFVVPKTVGNAVTRNRIKRRLRHLCGRFLAQIPRETSMVVRALPRAASEPARLEDDLRDAMRRCLAQLEPSAAGAS